MIVLACDTSNSTCCAGVYDGKKPLAYELSMDKRTHSETFMPLVDRVMKEAGLGYKDLDAFAVTTGPGSFTGIRIGLSAVKGMAFASGAKVIPVSSTMALAMSCEIADDTGRNTYFVPCFDARNDRVFARIVNARTCRTVIEENAYDASDLTASFKVMIGTVKPRIIVMGSGSDTVRRFFDEAGIRAEYAPGAVIMPSGVAAAADMFGVMIPGGEVKATYCAVSQAERLKKV
ncbi:Glycoprotease family protein [Ruminococcaceae bacterium YRB3002]|nr:Glycoprotease family protein [Ruminococcaceae bacterium YRB3002]